MKTIKQKTIELVSKECGQEVSLSTNLRKDLGLSSSDVSILLFGLEYEFKVIFPDELLTDELLTIARLIEYIERHQGSFNLFF
jgi:acyl carrier protein